MADNTVGVALGYGRGIGRVGGAAGFNAYEVRTAGAQHFAVGAKLESAGSNYEVACTQEQGVMDGGRWFANAMRTTTLLIRIS